MALSADKIIELYKNGLADGSIHTMEPLLSLFMLDNKPMSLVGREPMLPLFKTERPKRMTIQAGRQVSKSMNNGAIAILGSGFAGMQVAIFEPRFTQKRAINTQILSPLLRNCLVSDRLIRPNNIDTMDVKKMLSGGNIFVVNAVLTGDQARGLSGIGLCIIDECLQRDTDVFVVDTELKTVEIKKISEIKSKDILISFLDGAILYSVAARDASPRGKRPCYRVTTMSGRSVVCTSNHTFPTSIGKVRLSEVIEYVYRISERECSLGADRGAYGQCAERELSGATVECFDGVAVGGCVDSAPSNSDTQNNNASVESELETARVQFTQVPTIERARYARTCEEEESRLRGLLVDINPAQFKNVALVIQLDTYRGSSVSENCNSGILGSYNTPNSAGLVVYGRRIQANRSELRTNSDERVFSERGGATSELASEGVGTACVCSQSIPQQHQKRCLHYIHTQAGISEVSGLDSRVRPRFDAVQGTGSYDDLCFLRGDDGEVSAQMLFTKLRTGVSEGDEERADPRATSAQEREVEAVESCECRESASCCASAVFKHDAGAKRESKTIESGVFGATSGRDQSEETRLAGCTQRRSGIQSQESGARQGIPGEVETGSGAFSKLQSQESGLSEGSRPNTGSACSSNGTATYSSSESTRESRGACADIRTGSPGRRSTQGKLERGAQSGGAAEGARTQQSPSAKDHGRPGEGRGCPYVCPGVCKKEVGSVDGRTASCSECERSGATCAESTCGRSCTEESRTVQAEKESATVRDNSDGAILTPQPAEYAYDPIVSIEYVGYDDVYDIEVVGTHNYILANGICSYNCQDMLPSNIPVLEAVADAKVDTGFRIYSGTAKTLDGALAVKFEQSSQGHWCVKCSCGKFNIFAPEEQLFTTIRDIGCCCAFCGKILNSATGGFIHKFTSRVFEHPGYHLPQTIFPFHHSPNAWKELIYKKNSLPKTQFYNEVLGVSDSDSVRLLTKADLLAARNNVRSKDQAVELRGHYDLVVLGVDWGGGGGGESATGLAVIAKSFNNSHFETLYMRRLPTGLSPEQEASIVESVASDFRVDLIAHDYTGAGFMREAFFVQAYPEWRNSLFPVSYGFRPNASLVTTSESGSRASYVVDKTKSLLLTLSCIKHGVLTVPWFDQLDASAPQLDFLAIVEHKNKLEDVEGNVVQRRSEVYLLDKVAGVRDDAAQATNIGFIAACHTLGQYPVITYDSKFDITEDQRKLLLGE